MLQAHVHDPFPKHNDGGVETPVLTPPPLIGGEVVDPLLSRLRGEARAVAEEEPFLRPLLTRVGLVGYSHEECPPCLSCIHSATVPATSFEEVVSRIVCHRLSSSCGDSFLCPRYLLSCFLDAFDSPALEYGRTMSEAVRMDATAMVRRDPACRTLLEAILFMKGFAALVVHRAARRNWQPDVQQNDDDSSDEEKKDERGGERASTGKRFVALLLQSACSSALSVDIHPAATIGGGVMIDHATGVVIGETASVGDNCTILHGVTLGGTGKDVGDRHPKVGDDVLIGAGTKIFGNVRVGNRAKIGGMSVVLRPIPSGATAVGAPARIIGITPKAERPGSSVDITMKGMEPLMGKKRFKRAGLEVLTLNRSKSSLADLQDRNNSLDELTKQPSTVTTTAVYADESAASPPAAIDVPTGSARGEAEARVGENTPGAYARKDKVGITEGSREKQNDGEKKSREKQNTSGDDENKGDDDDDSDNVDEFGQTPDRPWIQTPKRDVDEDDFCPFRKMFAEDETYSGRCSKGEGDAVSRDKLRTLLVQEGCEEYEIIEVFFDLLQCLPCDSSARKAGCIPLKVFAEEFAAVAEKRTRIDPARCDAIASGDLRRLRLCRMSLSTFGGMFAKLQSIGVGFGSMSG